MNRREMLDEYAEEIAQERHERAMARRWCSECHHSGGSHHPGCPNISDAEPVVEDEAERQEVES